MKTVKLKDLLLKCAMCSKKAGKITLAREEHTADCCKWHRNSTFRTLIQIDDSDTYYLNEEDIAEYFIEKMATRNGREELLEKYEHSIADEKTGKAEGWIKVSQNSVGIRLPFVCLKCNQPYCSAHRCEHLKFSDDAEMAEIYEDSEAADRPS